MHAIWRSTIALALVLLAVACGGRASQTRASGTDRPKNTMKITAAEFDYQLSAPSVTAGSVEIVLENRGRQLHQAALYRLKDGIDVDEFNSAVHRDVANLPPLAVAAGGHLSYLPAGEKEAIEEELDPGTYMVVCFVRDFDTAKQHHTLGMTGSFEVH